MPFPQLTLDVDGGSISFNNDADDQGPDRRRHHIQTGSLLEISWILPIFLWAESSHVIINGKINPP